MEMGKTYRFNPDAKDYGYENKSSRRFKQKKELLNIRNKRKQKIKDQNELLDNKEFENV